MMRAYDEYGNIVDLVEWETKIRLKAIDDFVNECICYEHLIFEQEHIERMQAIAEQLKAGASNGTDNQ